MSKARAPRMRKRRWYALVAGILPPIALYASAATASASTVSIAAVQNHHSGLCMSVPGDQIQAGALINQYTCNTDIPDQHWIEESSDSHQGWFYFQPAQNDKLCVTYVPGSTAQLTLQYCGANAANGNPTTQLWLMNANDSLMTPQGWAMSVPGASTDIAPINIFPYGPYPDQAWSDYLW